MAQKSEIVSALTARGKKPSTVTTTIRLPVDMFERLKAQQKRWETTMSYIVEEALKPVLQELESSNPEDSSE